MIKGVNRQVLEISETGCEYFEKALFFVSPKYYGLGEAKLREKAQTLTRVSAKPPRSKTSEKGSRLKKAIALGAAAASGAILSAVIETIALNL